MIHFADGEKKEGKERESPSRSSSSKQLLLSLSLMLTFGVCEPNFKIGGWAGRTGLSSA